MIKHFCDVCGEPALDQSAQCATIGKDSLTSRLPYVLVLAKMKYGQEKTTDEGSDLCKKCLVHGIQKILEKLTGSKTGVENT